MMPRVFVPFPEGEGKIDVATMVLVRLFGIKFSQAFPDAFGGWYDVEGYIYDGEAYITKIEDHPKGAMK